MNGCLDDWIIGTGSIERIEENFQNLIDQEEEEDIADELQQQEDDLSEINEENAAILIFSASNADVCSILS